MVNNRPTVYNASSVYKTGGGGGGSNNFDIGQFLDGKLMPDGRIWATKNISLIPFPNGANGPNADSSLILGYGLCINWDALGYLISNKDIFCPGWNVPTRQEYLDLFNACNNQYSVLNGNGFNVQLTGTYRGGQWDGQAQYTFYWTRTSGGIGARVAYFKPSDPLQIAETWVTDLLPVRLIKDAE